MNKLIDSFINYLRYERNYSVYTVCSYTKDLEQFEAFVTERTGDPFEADVIDSNLVREWVVSLLDDKISPVSVNRKLSSLKSFFKFLVKQGIVLTNPLRLVNGPKTKKTLPYFVREGDLESLLNGDGFETDFEGERNRLIMEILYDTGIRRSELMRIKSFDIDYEASLLKVTGKRNKQRLIPFAERLKNQMQAYTTIRNREIGTESEWFFVRKNGTQLSDGMIYRIVKKSLSEIITLSKRSPHVLRHSFATSMLNNGADLNAVKELLGHSSLASTSVYTHTTFEELKKVYHAHPRAKKEGGFYGH
jgi:integrase/recombinase XerC